MKRVLFGMLLVACASSPTEPMTRTPSHDAILRTAEDVRKHVGEVITIEGVVDNSKWPTLLGVDVPDTDSDKRDVRNRKYRVTGRLETWKEESPKNGEIVQGRGPDAVHYRLKRADGTDGPVDLVPVP